jgi:hypothetical protein
MNLRIFSLRTLFTVMAILLLPALAAAQKSGYAWADQPMNASYIPSVQYSFNSSGGVIKVNKAGIGAYTVTFAGIGGGGPAGGNVQVTAYGNGSETCKVVSWNSGGADFIVNVRCFAVGGGAVDSRFSVRVVWNNATFAKHGYAWADQPATGSYAPSAPFSFNSSGGAININRAGVGAYTVTFQGIGGNGNAGGNVLVTAYGNGSEACKVVNWNSGGASFIANVRCFTTGGAPVDTRYSINVAW